jgi:hypothetical protein
MVNPYNTDRMLFFSFLVVSLLIAEVVVEIELASAILVPHLVPL